MRGTTTSSWGASPGRDERAGPSASAAPSHPCALSRRERFCLLEDLPETKAGSQALERVASLGTPWLFA